MKKLLKNLIIIKNNYYISSNIYLNFKNNFEQFFNDIENLKIYNINKTILFFNNKYYKPLEILKLPFFYFLFFSTFLLNLKINIVFFNINILNTFYILKKIKMKYSDVNLTKWSLPCARKMLKSQPVSHSHGLDVSVFVEFIHLFSTKP